MRKIKEIALNVDTSRVSSPHVKGKQPYFSGYGGSMNDSAASSYSSYMNSKKFPTEEDDESEEELDLMPENILNKRVKSTRGYSLNETLRMINEDLREFPGLKPDDKRKALEILDEMEEIHSNLITDVIDMIQSIVQIASPPGTSFAVAGSELLGGQLLQFGGGNLISQLGKLIAATRSDDRSSIVRMLSELAPFFAALPTFLAAPAVAIINKIVMDALECIGNLATILDKSPSKKDSLYRVEFSDVAIELLGDLPFSVIDSVDDIAFDVPSGIIGSGRLIFNLGQLWIRTGSGEDLIEEYKKIPGIMQSIEPELETGKLAATRDMVNQEFQSRLSKQEIGAMIDQMISDRTPMSEASFNLIDLFESDYYGIDEEPKKESLKDMLGDLEEDKEVEEHAVGGYALPLHGTKKDLENNMRLKEEVQKLQDWKLKTSGRMIRR